MFFRREKVIPLSEYAAILRGSLAEAVGLESRLDDFMLSMETDPRRFHQRCDDLEKKASQLRKTARRLNAVKPADASLLDVHECALRLMGAETLKMKAYVYKMRAMVKGESRAFTRGKNFFEHHSTVVENSSRELLLWLDRLQHTFPGTYAALALPSDLRSRISI